MPQVLTWWSPGEPEHDLHGFKTVRERAAFERGERGPFRRIVRNHHKLGPIDPALVAARRITANWNRK